MTPPPSSLDPRRWAFPALAGGGFALVVLLASVSLRWPDGPGLRSFNLLAPTLLYLGAIPLFLRRARRKPREAGGWHRLALGHGLVAVGALLRLAHLHDHLRAVPEQGPLALQLAGGWCLGWALLAWPLSPRTARERWRKGMDALVFTSALFFILWLQGWGPLFRTSPGPFSVKLFTLAFPLTSVLMFGVAIYLAAGQPRRLLQGPVAWVTLSLLFAFLGNLTWAFETLQGHTLPASALLEFCAFAMPMARLLAPCSPRDVGEAPREDPREGAWTGALLPYAPLAPALALVVHRLVRGATDWDPLLLWVAITMGALLLLRQFLATRDLQELSRDLERKVDARTWDLERSQAILLSTVRMNTLASLGAGVAHDLNNLLGAASLSSGLVHANLLEGLPPGAQDLERIQDTLARAGQLTSRLMAFGRAEETPSVTFDLHQQVRAAEGSLRLLLPRSITLLVEGEPGPLPLLGQPAHWDQILVNLVSNARDAMPAGGRITVRLSRSEGGRARLEVADEGQGMAPEIQERIFDPFFTTKAPGRGTGLGLASVRALVLQGGGHLKVRSVPGQGTTFTLEWPLIG